MRKQNQYYPDFLKTGIKRNLIRVKIVFIIFTVVLSSDLYGQGLFLSGLENGFEFKGQAAKNLDFTSYSFGTGYSYKGKIDLRFNFSDISFEEDIIMGFITGRRYQPSIVFHLEKQRRLPFGISIEALYDKRTFDGSYLDDNDLDMYGSGKVLSLDVYRKLEMTPEIPVVGAFKYSFEKTEDKMEGRNNNTNLSNIREDRLLDISLLCGYKFGFDYILYLKISRTIASADEPTNRLTIGYIKTIF
ncbi:hypothetical protein ACFL7D_00490 [candidate division KSB1 bacterium]